MKLTSCSKFRKTFIIFTRDNNYGDDIPPYAILSHRWSREEVTFDDLTKGVASTRHGFHKLKGFCEQAASDGFNYCWIDTCCIDKSSSAELSEAINSMFAWYRNSEVCIVYLQDVESSLDPDLPASVTRSFRSSEWFTRGWTLQELVAPSFVSFYGSDWSYIGSRTTLKLVISDVTKINPFCFGYSDLSDFPVAQRMSWAASRRTTRIEDEAYCLMGLFGINMPLLYGEGENAFRRLQEEIIRRSTDFSIFATATPRPWGTEHHDPFLAISPTGFRHSGSIRLLQNLQSWYQGNNGSTTAGLTNFGATITSRGVAISLPFLNKKLVSVLPWLKAFAPDPRSPEEGGLGPRSPDTLIGLLNCCIGDFVLGLLLEDDPYNSGAFRKCGVVLVNMSIAGDAQFKSVIVSTRSNHIADRWDFMWSEIVGTPLHVEFPEPNVSGFSFHGLHGDTTSHWSVLSRTTTTALISPIEDSGTKFEKCLLSFKPAEPFQKGGPEQGFYLLLDRTLLDLEAYLTLPLEGLDDHLTRILPSLAFGAFLSAASRNPPCLKVPNAGGSASLVAVVIRRGFRRWIVKVSITAEPLGNDKVGSSTE